jgi:hypothetical protein
MAVTWIPVVELVTLRAALCLRGKECEGGIRGYMDYMIAARALGALLICLAAHTLAR